MGDEKIILYKNCQMCRKKKKKKHVIFIAISSLHQSERKFEAKYCVLLRGKNLVYSFMECDNTLYFRKQPDRK